MASVYNGDAGGVVASILKTSQPIEENGRRFGTTNVANDSAHVWSVVAAVLTRKIRPFGTRATLQMRFANHTNGHKKQLPSRFVHGHLRDVRRLRPASAAALAAS